MDLYNLANCRLLDGDVDDAISKYTQALQSLPDFAPCYAYRALAYIQAKQYTAALQDCSKALALDDKLEPVYFRKGTACFELGEFETAKKMFEAGSTLRSSTGKDTTQYLRAIRKCVLEMADEELAAQNTIASTANAPAPSPAPAKTQKPVGFPPTRYEYYQTLDKMCISVLAKNVDSENASITMETNRLRVVLKRGDTDEVVIDKQLYANIDPAASKYDVRKTKIEISLVKYEKQNWPSLEGTASAIAPVSATPPVSATAAEPPSSSSAAAAAAPQAQAPERPKAYASNKDWDKLGNEIERELEAEKPEGEEALQKLFRDIYSKADEDTRRAMNKSFQTSGGTVLSTNWKEVSDKDYEEERQAPKGVEWKNWEGKKLPQTDD